MTGDQAKSIAGVGLLIWIVASLAGQPALGGIAFVVAAAAALSVYIGRSERPEVGVRQSIAGESSGRPRMSCPALWRVSSTQRQNWKGEAENFPVLVGQVDVLESGLRARFQLPVGRKSSVFQPREVKCGWDMIRYVVIVSGLRFPPAGSTKSPQSGDAHGPHVGLSIIGCGNGAIEVPLVEHVVNTGAHAADLEYALGVLEGDPVASSWLAILRDHDVRIWDAGPSP